jgi:hypothetical protein
MRKLFEKLSKEENPHYFEDGSFIYEKLKERYPNKNIEDLDSILNILCCSLSLLLKESVSKDNYEYALQLVHKVLMDNKP